MRHRRCGCGGDVVVNVSCGGEEPDPGPDPMVTICHMPGTPAEQTLEIPVSALRGHLNHGDTLGACPVTVDPEPEPEVVPPIEPEVVEPVEPVIEPEDPPVVEPEEDPEPVVE